MERYHHVASYWGSGRVSAMLAIGGSVASSILFSVHMNSSGPEDLGSACISAVK